MHCRVPLPESGTDCKRVGERKSICKSSYCGLCILICKPHFFFHWDVDIFKMFSSTPQVNIKQIAKFWFTGEKIHDYPKCQISPHRAPLAESCYSQCSRSMQHAHWGYLGLVYGSKGEANYSSVPEASLHLSDLKLAAWGCVFMLMRIQYKAA